jgi:membrane-bound lytic murein transglycosylase D
MDVKSPFSMQYNESVQKMISFYSTRRIKHLAYVMEVSEMYFPLFEEMLDKYSLPMELKYLSIVESALNPVAKSRAGAVGLWQFMPGTGNLYGLKINSKVDDRMDIYKSTEAACQHFCDLYARYHDWNLVLAAYNAGPGNVNKAIRRAGGSTTDYWEIRQYLPRETQSYVPAFIAVNYLMEHAQAHNIQPAELQVANYYSFDTVLVTTNVNLVETADWLGMDVETIVMLNPQYKKRVIPASAEKPYILTLPNEKIGEFIRNRELIISGLTRKEFDSQASQ